MTGKLPEEGVDGGVEVAFANDKVDNETDGAGLLKDGICAVACSEGGWRGEPEELGSDAWGDAVPACGTRGA